MKKFFLLIFFSPFVVYANVSDSMRIRHLQGQMITLEAHTKNIQRELAQLQLCHSEQAATIDSLLARQKRQDENLSALANKMGADLSEVNKNLESNTSSLSTSINNRTWLAASGILIALALLGAIYFILRKKIKSGYSSIDKIKAAQDSLETAQKAMQEESVKLDNKLVELLDKKIEATPTPTANEQVDHTLALKVADEIVRIETNLSRMDTSVKGYKQLAKAVERIRTNFLANGYEIVEMLGKPYNEGMKVVANFVSDDTLAEGEQKITGIIKPQINYMGKMIQSAQITVSQNL